MAYSWKKLASAAWGYSMARLALQTYMYVENLPQSYEGLPGWQREADEQFAGLLEAYLSGALAEEEVVRFRKKQESKMETIIAYADCFRIYEYAWNRIERRVMPDKKPTGMSDEDMTRALMGYLTARKDAAVANQRIQQVIGQLPVRLTRQKYYGMVREALTSYIGADMEGLNNEMYVLRTSAMTELGKGQKAGEPELCELLTSLQAVSMRDAGVDEYRDVEAKIRLAATYLETASDYLQLMQEMVNDLYVLLLTQEDAMRDAAEEAHAGQLLRGLCQVYREGSRTIPDALEEELLALEGVQEQFYEKYSRLDTVSGDSAQPENRKGRIVERLLSSSPFAVLEETKKQENVTPDAVDAAADALIAELEPVFAASQKPVVRAIMATTLSYLPVCFNSLDEIEAYIAGSFGSCSDLAEKEACKELLLQMMEMDDYAVV